MKSAPAVLALAFPISLQGALSASAADDPSSGDAPIGIIQDVVPQIAAQTSGANATSVDESVEGVHVETHVSDYREGDYGGAVSFSVDYATAAESPVEGLTVLATASDSVSAVVQPTAVGVRVLTAITSSSAPSSYSYTFDVPLGTKLVKGESRYYLESATDVLGQIDLPWARDADGKSLHTTFTWSGTTLTQNVDISQPDISFPVVADPAWGYTATYNVTKTAAKNKSLLKSCFNCYFPGAGAPRAFPKPGTLLPLTVGPANFECKFKSEFSGAEYFGFQFDATKNHVDGLGSNIVFEFRTVGGVKKLIVSAYIVNDAIWLNNILYRQGAFLNWALFAINLNNAS